MKKLYKLFMIQVVPIYVTLQKAEVKKVSIL